MKKIIYIFTYIFFISFLGSLEYNSILSVSEESLSVASKDSTLYVANLDGISIYNYSNEELELKNSIYLDSSGLYNRVYSAGNYLIHHKTDYDGDVILYDITDSENPVEITNLDITSINDCFVVDNYLLVRRGGLYVYDTQNIDLPPTQILASVGRTIAIGNSLFTVRYYTDSNRFVLEEYSMNLPDSVDLVDSLEINDTSSHGDIAFGNERIFVRENDYLYVFGYSTGLELLETFGPLPALDNDELNIRTIGNDSNLISADGYYWDISDVDNIIQYQSWRNSNHYYYKSKPTIIGDYYIKPNGEYGLVIVDMSDNENVQIIYDMNSYYNSVGIEIVGNTLLDVAYPKLKMFDVSGQDNMQLFPEGDNRDWNTRFKKYLATEDKLLLATDENLTILNTENGVANAEFSSSIDLGSIGRIATYNNFFYNIDGENLQMQITDISQPESPEISGSVNVNEIIYAPISCYVIDHYLLLVNEYLRVSIYDLSNPTQPEYLSSFSCNTLQGTQHTANYAKFEVKDNILYASFINYLAVNHAYLSDIFIYDITDIENWALLNTITSDVAYSNDIEVVGDYLYSVSNLGVIKINMYQIDALGNYSQVAAYNTETYIPSISSYFKVHNNKLYLSRESLLICYDIIYYTENDSYEIVPSNEINSYNYPNPFNPETTISYDITKKGNVTVDIYNLKGQKVKSLLSEKQEAGKHNVVWYGDNDSGKKVSSGTYLYRVKNGENDLVKKMVLMK